MKIETFYFRLFIFIVAFYLITLFDVLFSRTLKESGKQLQLSWQGNKGSSTVFLSRYFSEIGGGWLPWLVALISFCWSKRPYSFYYLTQCMVFVFFVTLLT